MNKRYRTEAIRNALYLVALLLACYAFRVHAARVAQYEAEREAIAFGHAVEVMQ